MLLPTTSVAPLIGARPTTERTACLTLVRATPIAVRAIRYFVAFLVDVLGGGLSTWLTEPSEQSMDSGRPAKVGVDERTQFVASVTVADTVADPFGMVITEGLTERLVMTGDNVPAPPVAGVAKIPSRHATTATRISADLATCRLFVPSRTDDVVTVADLPP